MIIEQKEKKIQKKQIVIISILIFILSLLYGTTYAYGSYFDTHGWQDFEFIHDAVEMDLKTMVGDLLFPGLDFFRGAHAQGVRTRIVEAFVLKGIHAFFGWEPFPYFFFKVLFIAGTSTIVFLFLYESTSSRFFATSGAFFFISLPSVFSSLLFMYDFGIIAEFFIILSFFLFLKYEMHEEKLSLRNRVGILYLFILSLITLLGLKTKASTLIIPAVLFLYLLLFMRKRITFYIPYFIFAFLFINPLYPLFHDQGSELGILPKFRFAYIYERLVLNNAWDYNAEQTIPAIFSLKDSLVRMPNTVTASFGFLLFWFLICCVLYLAYTKRKSVKDIFQYVRTNDSLNYVSKEVAFVSLFFIWFCIVLFFYQFDVMKNPLYSGTDMRYMTLAIVPLFLLLFTCASACSSLLGEKHVSLFGKEWSVSRLFNGIFIILLGLTIVVNIAHSTVHLRGGYNAHNYANIELFTTLYTNYSGNELKEYEFSKNYLYYKEQDDLLINRTFTNYNFFDFAAYKMQLQEDDINEAIKAKPGIEFYAVSLGAELNMTSFNMIFLKKIDPCSIGFYEQWYCVLFERKNNVPFVFYVYKIQ